MRKAKKRALYRELTKILGSPVDMTIEQRKHMFNLLGGWMGQRRVSPGSFWWYQFEGALKNRLYSKALAPRYFLLNHAELARKAFRKSHRSHWRIDGMIRTTKKLKNGPILGTVSNWNHLNSQGRKHFEIAIACNYHTTVAAHGVQKDGRKIVQRIWDHRIYTDREVWQCYFWNMDNLTTKDENSWKNITWHEGYVVKFQGHVAVDVNLQRAINLAQRRVVSAGVKSILGDFSDET